MILIGLIFIGAAVAVGIDVWQENSGHVTVQAFGHTFSQPAWAVVVVGAVGGALVVLGLALVAQGGVLRRRHYRERRRAIRDRDRLAKEAEAERASRERAEQELAIATAEVEQARLAASQQAAAGGPPVGEEARHMPEGTPPAE